MDFPTEYHRCNCTKYFPDGENEGILALSNTSELNWRRQSGYYTIDSVVENCNMLEHPDHLSDLVYTNGSPHISSQTDLTRESSSLSDANDPLWRYSMINPGMTHGDACICNMFAQDLFEPEPGSFTNIPDQFNGILDQDFSGSSEPYSNTSMPPGVWLGEHNLGTMYSSEPESFEKITESAEKICLEPWKKPFEATPCKQPGCEKTFGKKNDMERHFNSIHECAGYICGDCEDVGIKLIPKRKDHFLTHMYKHSMPKTSTWDSCKECPWLICKPENRKQSRLFSSQIILEKHLHLRHQDQIPYSSQQVEISSVSAPDDQDLSNEELSPTGIKRAHSPESHVVKRTCYGDRIFSPQPAFYIRRQENGSFVKTPESWQKRKNNENLEAAGLSEFQLVQSQPVASMSDCEVYLLNVTPVSFLALLKMSAYKLKTLDKMFLQAKSTSSEKPKMPFVSFNTSQRSILLRGSPDIVNFCKTFLEEDLEAIRSSRPLIYLNSPSTRGRLEIKDHLRTDFKTPTVARRSIRNSSRIFPIRKHEDRQEIGLWTRKILPSLFKILDESLGKNYSASLVREGISEQSSSVIIRIESPHVPALTTREDIEQQLDKACGLILRNSGIEVKFWAGSLKLLAGNRFSRRCKAASDDRRELPFHTRYWKYPGMGASIGLLCTEEEFATLGCYVEVDKQKYILTTNHFIEKSYGNSEFGAEDKETLTSPALAKVKTMRKELGNLLTILEGDFEAEWRKKFEGREVLMEDPISLPKEILEIGRKQDFVSEFAAELEKEKVDFKIGSLEHQCSQNGAAELSRDHSTVPFNSSDRLTPDLQSAEMRHRVDWSLFKADDTRMGANRHRYRHDTGNGITDFFPKEKDHGEGDICQDTCIAESNEKIYFVGQTNGRQTGIINAALRAVRHEGHKTVEHHIIMTADQKEPDKYYDGDSGAVVLRISDNKLVGLVWGSYNNDVIFTPIRTVFADIKAKLKAVHVDLPKVKEDPTSGDVRLISGTESEVKKQRPFKSSDVSMPPLSKEEGEKATQQLTLKFLERFKNNQTSPLRPASDATLPTTQKDRCFSPVPSLSFSRSPSPFSIPSSPSPSYRELTPTNDDTVTDSLVVIRGETSVTIRESSEVCNTDDENTDTEFMQDSNMETKLSIIQLLEKRREKPSKHGSYPGARAAKINPKLLRSLGTWPINSFDRRGTVSED